jgi:hypothetical protein
MDDSPPMRLVYCLQNKSACIAYKTSVTAAILSTLVMVWAVAVVILFRPAMLSRTGKQVVGGIEA